MPRMGDSRRRCASLEEELPAHNDETKAIREEWNGHTVSRLPRFSKAYARKQNKRQLSRMRQRDRYVKQMHTGTVVDAYDSGEPVLSSVTEIRALHDSWAHFEWIDSILSEDLLVYIFDWLPLSEALLMRRISHRILALVDKCLKTKRTITAGDFPPPYDDFWYCIVRGWNGYEYNGEKIYFTEIFEHRANLCIECLAKACPNIESLAYSKLEQGQDNMYMKLLEQFPRLRHVVQQELDLLCGFDVETFPEVLQIENLDLYVSKFASRQSGAALDRMENFVRRCTNVKHLRLTPGLYHEAEAPEVYSRVVPILRRLVSVESLQITYGRDTYDGELIARDGTPKSVCAYKRECEILWAAFPALTTLTVDTRYFFESPVYADLSSAVSESFRDQLQAIHLTDSLPRHFNLSGLTKLRGLVLDVEVVTCARPDTAQHWWHHFLTEEMINEKRAKQEFLLASLSTMSVFPESLRTLTVNLTKLDSRNRDCETTCHSRCASCLKTLAAARDELLRLGTAACLQVHVTL